MGLESASTVAVETRSVVWEGPGRPNPGAPVTDAPPGAALSDSRYAVGFGVLAVIAAAFVGYAAIRFPVVNITLDPVLQGGDMTHWQIAAAGFGIVAAFDSLAIWMVLRSRRRPAFADAVGADRGATREPRFRSPLVIQFLPVWAVAFTALVSIGVLQGAKFLGLPLWQQVLGILIVWTPLLVVEEVWKHRYYGFFAVFLGLAVLQVGHLAEHTVQVSQLIANHGDLTHSHGVFGQLDFETVHFVWDTLIWFSAAYLVYRFRANPWLWVSFVAASWHQVEHFYLFTINKMDYGFWAHGGIAGVMGKGGLLGSPLARPYLHFVYNFLVVVPMVIALLQETKRVRDRQSIATTYVNVDAQLPADGERLGLP